MDRPIITRPHFKNGKIRRFDGLNDYGKEDLNGSFNICEI